MKAGIYFIRLLKIVSAVNDGSDSSYFLVDFVLQLARRSEYDIVPGLKIRRLCLAHLGDQIKELSCIHDGFDFSLFIARSYAL